MSSQDAIAAEMKTMIAEILEVDPARIAPGTHFVRDLEMDSMMSLELLAALEQKYGIHIPEESLPRLATLEGAVETVVSRLASPVTG